MPRKKQIVRAKIVNDVIIPKKSKLIKVSRSASNQNISKVIGELERNPHLMKDVLVLTHREKGIKGVNELIKKHPFLMEFLTREKIITKEQIRAKRKK